MASALQQAQANLKRFGQQAQTTSQDLTSRFKSFITRDLNPRAPGTQSVANLARDPLMLTPLSMREKAVPIVTKFAEQTRKVPFVPSISKQTGEDIGFGLRGALALTPMQRTGKASPLHQTAPQTERQQLAQRIGTDVYGTLLTAPLGGPNYLRNIGFRAIQGGTLGLGLGSAGNVLTGKPLTEDIGKHTMEGISNAWQLAFTNAATDKIAAKFFPKLVTKNLTGVMGKLGTASVKGANAAVKKQLFLEGAKLLFARSLLEVPAESVFFTAVDKMSGEEKQSFVNAWVQNLPGTILGNLMFAGLQTTAGGGYNWNKKHIDSALETLGKVVKDQSGFINFDELSKAGQRDRTRMSMEEISKIEEPGTQKKAFENLMEEQLEQQKLEDDLMKQELFQKPGEAPPPPEAPSGKLRGFVETVQESPTTAKEVAEQVQGRYNPIPNRQTVQEAADFVKANGFDASRQKVFSEPLSRETNAIGLELASQAQQAGRYGESVEILEHLAAKGTLGGQATQVFAIWSRMTPEGMNLYGVKQIEKAKADMGGLSKTMYELTGKKIDDIKLTDADAKKITQHMEAAQKSNSEWMKRRHTKKALEVINKRLPWGISDVLDEMRYNNMLSNPKSHLRNAYNNALNTLVTRPGTLFFQGKPIEAAKYYGGVLTGLPKASDDFVKAMKGDYDIQKPDIRQLRSSKLPYWWQVPTKLMEAGDRFFSALIKNGMESSGASKEEAERIAEYTLLRQSLKAEDQGFVLKQIDAIGDWVQHPPKGAKWTRWFTPFVRTPLNAVKQWIEYSPAGVATLPGAKNKGEQISKTVLGSLVMLVGAKFAAEGKVTWAAPTDRKTKELFYASGRKPFSILIGDRWVPMWYAGPFAAAMAFPAAVRHYQAESKTALTDSELDKLTSITGDMASFVMSQSPLASLNTFARLISGDFDYSLPRNLGFTASQMIPFTGTLNYIADVIDPVYRKPRGFAESVASGVPFLSTMSEPYTEPTGAVAMRDPQNYFLPYDLGTRNQFYEPFYKERIRERQLAQKEKFLKEKVQDEMVKAIMAKDSQKVAALLPAAKRFGVKPSDVMPIVKQKQFNPREHRKLQNDLKEAILTNNQPRLLELVPKAQAAGIRPSDVGLL